MANFSGYYMELGQPIYANSLFLGMEFPMGENRIENKKLFIRYYYGQEIEYLLNIHNCIIGSANGFSKKDIQRDFF